MPSDHPKHHELPKPTVTHHETHVLPLPHGWRPYSDAPSFQQHQHRTPYPFIENPLQPPQPGNSRPPHAFRPINALGYQAQPSGPPQIPRSVPTEPREKISDITARSDKILAKLSTYTSNHALPCHTTSPPAPSQLLTWSQVSALEAGLLVTVIATLSKLDEAIKTLFSQTVSNPFSPAHEHSDPDPTVYINILGQRLRTAERSFLRVMHPAYVCCEMVNEVRDRRWVNRTQGRDRGGQVLSLVFEALETVVGMENVVFGIDGLIGESEKDWERWASMVERYVDTVVGVVESAKVAVEKERERWGEGVGVANCVN